MSPKIDYRGEVADLDRRHTRRKRLGIGAVIVAAATMVLWKAGVSFDPIAEWWKKARTEDVARKGSDTAPGMMSTTEMPASQIAIGGTDSSISKVPLPLTVVSTSPGQTPEQGTARLGPDPGNPQTYAAGALLENGARLVQIHSDRVILQRDGQRATLYVQGVRAPNDAENEKNAALLAKIAHVGGREPYVLTEPSSVDTISESIRAQPAYDNGRLVGLQVYPGVKKDFFAKAGLEPGDVIHSVEGAPVSKDMQWTDISQALMGGKRINVTVIRRGDMLYKTLEGLRESGPNSSS